MITKVIWSGLTALVKRDYVRCNNMILPPANLRFCGKEFKDDHHFLASAQKEIDRLVKFCGLNVSSHVLDIGCGPGRLPIGILSCVGEIEGYSGFDVDIQSIKWCQRHIARRHPTFKFTHLDLNNARYNPCGKKIDSGFRFLSCDQDFDIIYLYSVFSHMIEEEVRVYLREFQRLLTPGGKIFLTGFIEAGVPEMTVNPSDYRMDWHGPLHCVRYNKAHFESVLDDNDFAIDRFEYETETDGQSAIYASKRKSCLVSKINEQCSTKA